jgi:spore germination protein
MTNKTSNSYKILAVDRVKQVTITQLVKTLIVGFIFLFASISVHSQSTEKAYTLDINNKDQTSDTLNWDIDWYFPEKGMLQDHKTLFTSLHGSKQKITFTGIKEYKKITYDTVHNKYNAYLRNTDILRPEAEVFGWHPYWINESYKYYPYSLLTKIAFYAYDVNEHNGSYNDSDAITKWKSTPMIDSAHKNNIKILLSVTSYGKERNENLLQNRKAWTTLGDSLLYLLRLRQAQGVDFDFTGLSKEHRNNFCTFMNTLRSKLGDTCFISIHITPKDLRSSAFDLTRLKSEARINKFIIQSYDYEETYTYRRAIAPLYSGNYKTDCIIHTVNYCLHNGLKEKDLILNLPLLGTVWYNDSDFKKMAYSDIVDQYEKNYTSHIDLLSESTSIAINKQKDTIVWYESGESIYRKFLWAKVHNLAGIGLWGLGYDGGRSEVWNAVVANYGVQLVQEITPTKTDHGKTYALMLALQKYRKIIGIGLFILISFVTIGSLLSLLDWRVRETFFRNYLYRTILTLVLLVGVMISLYCFKEKNPDTNATLFFLIMGAMFGGSIVYIITKISLNNRKNMP